MLFRTLLLAFLLLSTPAIAGECVPWTLESAAVETSKSLPNGVMVTEVREESGVVWLRTKEETKVRLRVSAGEGCEEIQTKWKRTKEEDFFIQTFSLNALSPGTRYRYWVELKGKGEVASGAFVTAPTEDKAFRLAFSADISKKKRMYGLFDELSETGADLYISLGDWPIADEGGPVNGIEEYRAVYSRSRKDKRIQKWMQTMSIHATWDDHEVHNNWDAKLLEEYPERVADGVEVWNDFFPVKDAPKGEIYRSFKWGPEVEFFMLDLRSHRDSNKAEASPEKTMLGEAQREWLFEGLKASEASFKLVVTTVPFYYGTTGKDHWKGFEDERALLFEVIEEARITGVVFLTADQHWLAVHHLPQGMKIYQAGAMAQTTRPPAKGTPPWVVLQHQSLNFATLDYQPGNPPTLTFTAIGNQTESREDTEDPATLYRETITPEVGQLKVEEDKTSLLTWSLEGAHTYVGHLGLDASMAPAGKYTLTWRAIAPELIDPVAEEISLAEGESLTIQVPQIELPTPLFVDRFDSPLSETWVELDDAKDKVEISWVVEEGSVREESNLYDKDEKESDKEKAKREAAGDPPPIALPKLGSRLLAEITPVKNLALAARVYAEDNDAFGLVYGVSEAGYYRASFDRQRSYARLVRVDLTGEEPSYTLLAELRDAEVPSAYWSVMAVVRDGEQHRVYLEDQLILEANDDTLGEGIVGLYSWGMDDLRVDDFALWAR